MYLQIITVLLITEVVAHSSDNPNAIPIKCDKNIWQMLTTWAPSESSLVKLDQSHYLVNWITKACSDTAGFTIQIKYDPTNNPSFKAYSYYTNKLGVIVVSDRHLGTFGNSLSDTNVIFQNAWYLLMFEYANLIRWNLFDSCWSSAISGKLSCDEFAAEMVNIEAANIRIASALFDSVVLPYIRSWPSNARRGEKHTIYANSARLLLSRDLRFDPESPAFSEHMKYYKKCYTDLIEGTGSDRRNGVRLQNSDKFKQ